MSPILNRIWQYSLASLHVGRGSVIKNLTCKICTWGCKWVHRLYIFSLKQVSFKQTLHCKKGKVVLTQFGYLSFLLLVCIVKHSEVPLPALDSKQIKNLIRLSRTLVNVMGEYFANEVVQSCGKWHETEVTAMG